jgi:hypothetical protein
MKRHIYKYICLSVILILTAVSCINSDISIKAPLVNGVSNLKYTLNGDSVNFTWTNPQTTASLTASIQYNGGVIAVNGKNPSSYSFGVVQTNVPYLFTVKLLDAAGNLSLGQTVTFTRAGADPVTNVVITQTGSNSVHLAWTLPSETLTGLTISMGATKVTLPGTQTDYDFQNVPVGAHLFGIVATDNKSQISNTVYTNFKVGPTVVAYLSTDADSLHIANHEQAAAAKWLFANFPSARFVSFNQVKSGAINLSQFDVVWWNYDIENGPALPAIATDATVLGNIQTYYQNGGKLLCSVYAVNYLWNLGRLPGALQTAMQNDAGNGGYNGDVWTVNIDIDGKQDNSTHPLFKGLTTTTQGDGEKVFPVIGAGWKENHNCLLVGLPNFLVPGMANNNDAAYSDFCNTYTAKWLGCWGGISDYFTAGIFELDATSTYKGTALAIGIGGIEWDQLNATGTASMVNPYQANVYTLYTNALSFLKSK